MTDDEAVKEIKHLIVYTKDWNEGLGLIVPERLGKRLKELGFVDGYTVDQNLPAHVDNPDPTQ